MFNEKVRSEKVKLIKTLIRENDYKENQKIHEQCLKLGFSVNLVSLSRFSEKLKLLDRSERFKSSQNQTETAPQTSQKMSYEQVRKRETEITFELGELKIKENKLLEELNSLSLYLIEKH
ncbi:MAG: arginine repressor [Paraglaciecola sp.]|jgi:arginine repressor